MRSGVLGGGVLGGGVRGGGVRGGGALTPVAVPYVGWLIGVPAVLAHAFALVGLAVSWSDYRSPWAVVALFVVSAALPVALVVVPRRRRDGLLPRAAAATVVFGVFGVSVGVPALLPSELRSSLASWNWGTGAMTFLGLAAYLSALRTIGLGCAHAALAVAVQLLSGGGLWRIQLVLVATLVPPLGAAQYLRFYADALRQRSRAGVEQVTAERGRRELDAVLASGDRRLVELRQEIEPLLLHVADGGPLPLDDVQARQARQLAERLRGALVAHRRSLWLPDQVGAAPVTVVCSEAAADAVSAADRAWLAALLDLLASRPDWRAVHVVLDPGPGRRVGAVVTAEGAGAAAAAADPRIQALVRQSNAQRPARLDVDGNFLTVDTDLHAPIGA